MSKFYRSKKLVKMCGNNVPPDDRPEDFNVDISLKKPVISKRTKSYIPYRSEAVKPTPSNYDNTIWNKPYSLTGPIFNKFNEYKTSYSSLLDGDTTSYLTDVVKSSEKIIFPLLDLTCHEEMIPSDNESQDFDTKEDYIILNTTGKNSFCSTRDEHYPSPTQKSHSKSQHTVKPMKNNSLDGSQTENFITTQNNEMQHLKELESLQTFCLKAINKIKFNTDNDSEEVVVFVVVEESDAEISTCHDSVTLHSTEPHCSGTNEITPLPIELDFLDSRKIENNITTEDNNIQSEKKIETLKILCLKAINNLECDTVDEPEEVIVIIVEEEQKYEKDSTCNAASTSDNDEDFDSDDSVRDKDYCPSRQCSEENSSDSENDEYVTLKQHENIIAPTQKKKTDNFLPTPKLIEVTNLDTNRSNQDFEIEIECERELESSKSQHLKSPENVLVIAREESDVEMVDNNDGQIEENDNTIEENENTEDKNSNNGLYTKDGKLRKRKKYATSVSERKKAKEMEFKDKHYVKEGCSVKCILKCKEYFTTEDRIKINKYFWNLSWRERRIFIQQSTSTAIPKRKITSVAQRCPRRNFYLLNSDNKKLQVCKIFFLTTLGFRSNNDKVLYNALNTEIIDDDMRGKHTKTAAINREVINLHINSFNPCISHYRRVHAPNRKYLPSDITIKFMYEDFKIKNPNIELSYEIYRKQVKSLNISFTRLGHEECEICEEFKIHGNISKHNEENALDNDCTVCKEYKQHTIRSNKARQLYDSHKDKSKEDHIYFSADLEKVIMLPRCDTFKEVVFCPRLIAFNQTFAPVGTKPKQKPFAVLWHEAIAGRKQEDIISAFKAFLMEFRDVRVIEIWLDNCSSQNKNWLLYFFLVHFINSDDTCIQEIKLNYFEKGHTFMSCDSFHHQVELSMKKKAKLYDFKDFVDSVSAANSGRVTVKEMTLSDFIKIEDFTSPRRIQSSTPRAYMKNIVQATFKRGQRNLFYKTDFDGDIIELCFLKGTYLKPKSGPITVITTKNIPRGIKESRRSNILNKLGKLMPPHKKFFWENIPITDCEVNID